MTLSLAEEVRIAQRLPAPAEARAIRIAAHVSISRLSEELGVSRKTITRWESGTRNPSGAHRVAYAKTILALADAISTVE